MLATSLNSKTVPSSGSACTTEGATFTNTQTGISEEMSLAGDKKVDGKNQTEEENENDYHDQLGRFFNRKNLLFFY